MDGCACPGCASTVEHSMSRVIIYARVSTLHQAEDGKSIDSQVRFCRQYCELYGLEVASVIRDEGASAKSLNRPGWRMVEQALVNGDADGVVAYSLDRFTRRLRDLLDLVESSQSQGWALHSVSERFDTSTPAGRMVVNMLGVINQWQREQIAERTRAALARKKAEGMRLGPPPVAFRGVGGGLLEFDRDHPKAAWVLRAGELRGHGLSLRAIGHQLLVEGVSDRCVAPNSVKRLLVSYDLLAG